MHSPSPIGVSSTKTFRRPNKNHIDPKKSSIVLLCYLFGHTSDVFGTVTQGVIDPDDVTLFFADGVHKKDALSVVSDVYT